MSIQIQLGSQIIITKNRRNKREYPEFGGNIRRTTHIDST